MRGQEQFGSRTFFRLSVSSACCWRWMQYFGRGRDKGFVLYLSLFLQVLGWCLGVCVYTCVHYDRVLGINVSPGVGRTPKEPEESIWTNAWHTCRLYIWTAS